MRAMDVLLAFPPIILLLILATGAGPSAWVLVIGVAITHVPGIARIVRAATLEVSVKGYVEAAVARGERRRFMLGREILPNIALPVLADAGVRLTGSILLVASVNFLGLGLQPPSADWALMISENRGGLTIQAWASVVPIVLIAALTIGVNLIADAFARSLGRSVERARIAR
jgi:ABC-type dipeptide/oligopeptide/nickel transport system permease subunit